MKYKNKKTEVDGIPFSSKKEAKRYEELKAEQEAGNIRNLRLQPEYHVQEAYVDPATGQRVKPIKYIADFYYERHWQQSNGWQGWMPVVEDVKGVQTDVFKLKYNLMIEKFGIWVDII